MDINMPYVSVYNAPPPIIRLYNYVHL